MIRQIKRPLFVMAAIVPALCLALFANARAGNGEASVARKTHLGVGAAYEALGRLPVLHEGRIKPFDTMAREELRDVYGPGTIVLKGDKPEMDVKWSAVGALLDWPARPAFWDQQEIILIDLWDYRGFKQELLEVPIKEHLRRLLALETTSAAAKNEIERLIHEDVITEKALNAFLDQRLLDKSASAELKAWAAKLGEGRKRVAPAVLEAAMLKDGERRVSFDDWFKEVYPKGIQAERSRGAIKLSPREEMVFALGKRLAKYQGFRDGNTQVTPETDIPVIPRPYSEAYIKHTGSLIHRIVDVQKTGQRAPDGSAFDDDVSNALGGFLASYSKPRDYIPKVLDGREKIPGEDAKFDRSFRNWLREASNWIPLRLVMEADLSELAAAGLPEDRVKAFRSAHSALAEAERSAPGELATAPALAFVAAARNLGDATSPAKYPAADRMSLEAHFSGLDPFGRAPMVFGLSLVLLLISLGISAERGSTLGKLERALHGLGVLGLASGIALEAYGFYLRISISGWAPVTNMYETVIWVAFGAAVLGLILEAIFRRKYTATAASGIALLATLLAANVPLLDSDIGRLQPVLRDNFWLTVHVLTIVSSYAAFSLVMGLGLLGLAYYLSATYRNDASYRQLSKPLIYGVPLIPLGILFYTGVARHWYLTPELLREAGWLALGIVAAGGFLCVMGLSALMGEFANRHSKAAGIVGALVAAAGAVTCYVVAEKTPEAWWPTELPLWFLPGVASVFGMAQIVLSGLGGRSRRVLLEAESGARTSDKSLSAGDVKALSESLSVAERVRLQSATTALDPRGQAIQATVAQIKPLSNFIYRAMQVGVLLVATGTFLGGWWADKSWGRFWGWDPKEVWALITLLVYLVPLHGRFAGWVSTFGLVAASVVCYNSVLMAWYGVNWVLGVGLHSYGFTEGGGQGVVLSSALALIAIVFGTSWRRRLGSRAVATGSPT